jgi:hypothetical protein
MINILLSFRDIIWLGDKINIIILQDNNIDALSGRMITFFSTSGFIIWVCDNIVVIIWLDENSLFYQGCEAETI